jgi:purine-binding chemotaxis protein CheW
MARSSDPKKRGKGKPPENPGRDHAPAPRPTDDPPPADDSDFVAPRWVSSEESLSFPSEPYTPPGPPTRADEPNEEPSRGAHGRIALPSSGLASDILARQDTVSLAPTVPMAPEPSPMPAPAPAVATRGQSVALFGATSRDDRKAAPELMEHLVTFYLADEEYGLDVRTVQEIIRVTDTTHVPRAPQFIKGVINLRGRIIPVVDLKKKLDLGELIASRLSRIVVVKLRDRLIGLLVDGASQVLKIPVSSIDAAPEEILDVNVSFIRGVAKLEKRLIILLDLYKILAMEIEQAAAQ